MKRISIILIISLMLTGCNSNDVESEIVNEKIFNGLSFPVDGGEIVPTTSSNITISFENTNTDNLYSMCNGFISTRDRDLYGEDYVEIVCDNNALIKYNNITTQKYNSGNKVKVGERIGTITDEYRSNYYSVELSYYTDYRDEESILDAEEFMKLFPKQKGGV